MNGALCVAGALMLVERLPATGTATGRARGVRFQALGADAPRRRRGARSLWSGDATGAAFSGGLAPALGVDRLSGVFLLMLGVVAVPPWCSPPGYLDCAGRSRAVAALTGALRRAVVVLLCARDSLTFLGAWELMTLVPAAIILVWRTDEDRARRSVFVYVAVTHLAGAGTWVALLVLADARRARRPALDASSSSRRAQSRSRRSSGSAPKAGVMPLHVWLPRAHPIAPAPRLGADERGDDQGRALRPDARARRVARPCSPSGSACRAGARGRVGASAGSSTRSSSTSSSGCSRFTRSRTSASSCSGSARRSSCARAGRPGLGGDRARRRAAAHAQPRRLQGAAVPRRRGVRARGRARSSSTGSAACCGGCRGRAARSSSARWRSPALPPLNGFASEWLTLQALLHLALTGSVGAGVAGAVALAALAATAALAVFCFVKVVGLVLLGAPRAQACADAVRRRWPMRAALVVLAGAVRRARRRCPGCSSAALARLAARAGAARRRRRPASARAPAALPTLGDRGRARRCWSPCCACGARAARAAPAPTWACGQLVEPALALDERRVHEAAAPRARGAAAAGARDRRADRGRRSCRRSPTAGACRT